jgi:hypothetical protein
MEKIKSMFGKSSGPTLDSVQDDDYGSDSRNDYQNDLDEPTLEGVGDRSYTDSYNQVQTEMFMPRRRGWGVPDPVIRPQPQQTTEFEIAAFEGKNMMYVEEEDIDALADDIRALGEIAQDMSVLLDVQEEHIDKIDTNVAKSNKNVEKAGSEVEETLRLMKSTKYKKGAITTTGCAVIGGAIGVIGGPPGIAIGAGIGGAIGLVGSTLSSIF